MDWIKVSERLPEETGRYIVWLQSQKDTGYDWISPDDLSYATEMFFNKQQMIWNDESAAYNAVLNAVDTEHADSVTHWMPLPGRPEK